MTMEEREGDRAGGAPGLHGETWVREGLLASRLAPEEELPQALRWIDLEEGLQPCGGRLLPGRVALDPAWVARLLRWRLAGLHPLVATANVEPGSSWEEALVAALEADVLTGGTFDALRILPPAPFPDDVGPGTASPSLPADLPRAGGPGEAALAERIRGGMLGLAVGDALGAPVENWPAEKILRVHGMFRDYVSGRGWGPGHPTRETTLALLWFREIAAGRTVHLPADRDRIAASLARWVTGRPRDFGHLTRAVLRAFRESPPIPAAREAWEKAHRLPEFNSALSRAAAIGLALPYDFALRAASTLAAAGMTQPAPVCLAAAVLLAEGTAAAARGEDPLEAARAVSYEPRTAAALEGIEAAGGWEPGGEEWNGHERGHPLKTLQAAFWASKQGRRRGFEEVILDLIHRGGDADTHAAAAGAILGAQLGVGSIPRRWLEGMRLRELVEFLVRPRPAPPRSEA